MMKFAAAAALTLSMAGAAQASTMVNIAISGMPGANQISYNGGTKHLAITNLATKIDFLDSFYNDGAGLNAILNLTADTTDALDVDGGLLTQTGFHGTFSFTKVGDPTVEYLGGTFTNYWIQTSTAATSASLDSVEGTANFTSDLFYAPALLQDAFSMSFSGIVSSGVTPTSGIRRLDGPDADSLPGDGDIASFTGGGVTGTFSAVVPEPGTWALMIVGFGGAGAMLRSRRRSLAAAA